MSENENNEKPVFKTIESFEKPYGTRNFIEIALKETNGGENVFFSISKGFTAQNDVKRYKKSLGFSASEDLQKFIVDSFTKLLKTYKKVPRNKSKEEAKSANGEKTEEEKEETAEKTQKAEKAKEEKTAEKTEENKEEKE